MLGPGREDVDRHDLLQTLEVAGESLDVGVGDPPGKTHEYLAAVEVVLKETPDALVTEPLDDELDEDALDGEEP